MKDVWPPPQCLFKGKKLYFWTFSSVQCDVFDHVWSLWLFIKNIQEHHFRTSPFYTQHIFVHSHSIGGFPPFPYSPKSTFQKKTTNKRTTGDDGGRRRIRIPTSPKCSSWSRPGSTRAIVGVHRREGRILFLTTRRLEDFSPMKFVEDLG